MEDSAHIVPEAPTKLWLPGLGAVDPEVRAIARAVRDYDPDLHLQRHELTGDWVVTLGESGHPIFGFGLRLPHPDDVAAILSKRDVKRNGQRILADLARQAEIKRQEAKYRVSEQDGELAERLEHSFRIRGAHPTTRIFVPRGL